MKTKEIIQKIHEDCKNAVKECPNITYEADDEYTPMPKSILGLYKFWTVEYAHSHIIWDLGYEECLSDFSKRFFDGAEVALGRALEEYCNRV
jgi:hypothetical protein